MSGLLGARKPLNTTQGSPMPGMPGTDDDDLDIDLVVKKPPPPLGNGTFQARVSRVKVWTDDEGNKTPTVELTITDPAEKTKADRNEPSNYGTTVSFRYPLEEGWKQQAAMKLIAGLGYPPSAWPETNDGRLNLGPILRRIKGELICDPPHSSPLFDVTVRTTPGKGKYKDRPFVNVKTISKVPAKPNPAGQNASPKSGLRQGKGAAPWSPPSPTQRDRPPTRSPFRGRPTAPRHHRGGSSAPAGGGQTSH